MNNCDDTRIKEIFGIIPFLFTIDNIPNIIDIDVNISIV